MSALSALCWVGAGVAALSGAYPVAAVLAIAGAVTGDDESESTDEQKESLRQASEPQNQALAELARQNRNEGDRGIEIERVVEEAGPLGTRNRVVDRQRFIFDDE